MAIIPDVPEEREIQLKRTEFLTEKIISQVADDDIEEESQSTSDPIMINEYPNREAYGSLVKRAVTDRNSASPLHVDSEAK